MLDVCLSDEFVIKKRGSWKFILHTWTAAVFEAFQMNVEEQCDVLVRQTVIQKKT